MTLWTNWLKAAEKDLFTFVVMDILFLISPGALAFMFFFYGLSKSVSDLKFLVISTIPTASLAMVVWLFVADPDAPRDRSMKFRELSASIVFSGLIIFSSVLVSWLFGIDLKKIIIFGGPCILAALALAHLTEKRSRKKKISN